MCGVYNFFKRKFKKSKGEEKLLDNNFSRQPFFTDPKNTDKNIEYAFDLNKSKLYRKRVDRNKNYRFLDA